MRLLVCTALLIISSARSAAAQKMFAVKYSGQADLKVHVVDFVGQADLKVFKVSSAGQAGKNDGRWYFTDTKGRLTRRSSLWTTPDRRT